jgi:hypothetical protein
MIDEREIIIWTIYFMIHRFIRGSPEKNKTRDEPGELPRD